MLKESVDQVLAVETERQRAGEFCLRVGQTALSVGVDPAVVYGELARLRQSGAAGMRPEESRIDLAAELRACTSKKAALTVLYRERIKSDDSRSLNAIAEQLIKELAGYGIALDRGAAHKYVTELHQR
ncbi:hypothetical protein [Streptomyces sp. NPDC058254]|uniref:hypothetical protein n=1 Tax=Streptomyces sp. NPDC058254 TaxID=3346406 RepID=UPI0036E1F4F7